MTATNTSAGQDQSPKTPSKQRSFSFSNHFPSHFIYFLITFIIVLIILQNQSLKTPYSFSFSSSSSWPIFHRRENVTTANLNCNCRLELNRMTSRLRDMVTFLPLKDLRFAHNPTEGHTWFMSSLEDTYEEGETEYLHFPSETSKGRLLCLSGHHTSNGSMNFYALAWKEALPYNATLLGGLTFVSDTHYDYENIWHGLAAVVPFVAWQKRKGCVVPARWVLFHWGELRTSMSPWVRTILEVASGEEVVIEGFEGHIGPTCFEEALVFRHNEGKMVREKKEEVYDMLRCKARAYCNISREVGDSKVIRMTLFLRVGPRSFKDDPAVIRIFERECKKVDGCRFMVARPNNLTFCDQVRLMSNTDILVSPHGAQLTNLFFMDKNSSVMEFFPKGWLELAGVGQYVYHWLASWSGMRHKGVWRDPQGQQCPHNNNADCFTFVKDHQIGHDEAFFSNWSATVLEEMKEYKLGETSRGSTQTQLRPSACPCG